MEGNKVYLGDCLDLMKNIKDNTIDLVFTSPPYAERRKETYGGTNENEYVDWFLPIGAEIKRILKPTGSFFLNIKPHTNKGERSLYVYDLICRLKRETVNIHLLRHNYATHSLEAGENLYVTQKVLGHSSPKTTADIYYHISPHIIANAYSPINNIKI